VSLVSAKLEATLFLAADVRRQNRRRNVKVRCQSPDHRFAERLLSRQDFRNTALGKASLFVKTKLLPYLT
jgi:hypothetical protein